jgi:hypothetical protein
MTTTYDPPMVSPLLSMTECPKCKAIGALYAEEELPNISSLPTTITAQVKCGACSAQIAIRLSASFAMTLNDSAPQPTT